MWTINKSISAAFEAGFSVMESWPGWLSLTVFSIVVGVLAMVAYKYTSNQRAIGAIRDDIKANLLAVKLFKDELPVTFKAQGRVFVGALKLFLHSLVPLAVMLIPLVPLITQMAMHYEWRPLPPGQEILLFADLKDGTPLELHDLQLETPQGLAIEAGPQRVYLEPTSRREGRNQVVWRLRAGQPGQHAVTIRLGSERVLKQIPISDQMHARACPVRPGASVLDQILYPAEQPARANDTIQRVEARLPTGSTPVFGWDMHWIITFLIVSIIAALIAKPIFKVRI